MIQQIKNNISVYDICEKYSIEVNRTGFTKCLFHDDQNASMKLYKNTNTFKCFSCSENADAISFVQKLFNISFKQALARINADFNLRIKT